jgi:hypothetical protein
VQAALGLIDAPLVRDLLSHFVFMVFDGSGPVKVVSTSLSSSNRQHLRNLIPVKFATKRAIGNGVVI